MIEYVVRCQSRAFHLSVQLNMVDIEKGDIIYGENQNERKLWRTCSDSGYTLPSKSHGLKMLASNIATKFSKKLTPFYYRFDVVLLDEFYLDFSDKEEKMLENAIVYIEHKHYDKAESILKELFYITNEKCYVVTYNLAPLKEIKGELKEAQELHSLADNLTPEPVEAIDKAIVRIRSSLRSRTLANKQIER